MIAEIKKDILGMIEKYDYMEVSGIMLHPKQGRQMAFNYELWYFQLTDRDSWILWNGKGEDPRRRERVQQNVQSK